MPLEVCLSIERQFTTTSPPAFDIRKAIHHLLLRTSFTLPLKMCLSVALIRESCIVQQEGYLSPPLVLGWHDCSTRIPWGTFADIHCSTQRISGCPIDLMI